MIQALLSSGRTPEACSVSSLAVSLEPLPVLLSELSSLQHLTVRR